MAGDIEITLFPISIRFNAVAGGARTSGLWIYDRWLELKNFIVHGCFGTRQYCSSPSNPVTRGDGCNLFHHEPRLIVGVYQIPGQREKKRRKTKTPRRKAQTKLINNFLRPWIWLQIKRFRIMKFHWFSFIKMDVYKLWLLRAPIPSRRNYSSVGRKRFWQSKGLMTIFR